ncbi:hypothetical protein [Anaerotignum lactatifermentans]|uniref:hypothetical protein n=1 Tax=Anaerotignum lactatifermentans TaxID=160404 RepID=UPI003AB24579
MATKQKSAAPVAQTEEAIKAKKPVLKRMPPDALVEVKSNFYGLLYYKSKVTGYECEWSNYGDINLMTIAELQNMRNGQRKFFTENWIVLAGDNAQDALDWLQVRQYYGDIVELDSVDEVFQWSPEKIEGSVAKMAQSAKDSIVMRAYDMIQAGELYDMRVIRAVEKATGYALLDK